MSSEDLDRREEIEVARAVGHGVMMRAEAASLNADAKDAVREARSSCVRQLERLPGDDGPRRRGEPAAGDSRSTRLLVDDVRHREGRRRRPGPSAPGPRSPPAASRPGALNVYAPDAFIGPTTGSFGYSATKFVKASFPRPKNGPLPAGTQDLRREQVVDRRVRRALRDLEVDRALLRLVDLQVEADRDRRHLDEHLVPGAEARDDVLVAVAVQVEDREVVRALRVEVLRASRPGRREDLRHVVQRRAEDVLRRARRGGRSPGRRRRCRPSRCRCSRRRRGRRCTGCRRSPPCAGCSSARPGCSTGG